MSIWRKDLSFYVWPWLEPVFGALFLFVGVKAIVTGELHLKRLVYHGVTCYVGGAWMVLFSYLLFRGRIYRM
jgi:hypothetical protein